MKSLYEEAINSNYIIFSVIGSHAGEQTEEILDRKSKDLEIAKESFWIAKINKKDIEVIKNLPPEKKCYVILIQSSSNGTAAKPTKISKKASEFSKDSLHWLPISKDISDVTGNIKIGTTAFCFNELEKSSELIDLNDYEDIDGNPIRFNNCKSTILARHADEKKTNGMKSPQRSAVSILKLTDIVFVR